jgi:hypothetical protein
MKCDLKKEKKSQEFGSNLWHIDVSSLTFALVGMG